MEEQNKEKKQLKISLGTAFIYYNTANYSNGSCGGIL